jgi:hypothetical protein
LARYKTHESPVSGMVTDESIACIGFPQCTTVVFVGTPRDWAARRKSAGMHPPAKRAA